MPRIPKPKVPSTGTVAPKLSEQPEGTKYDHMAAAALALSAPGKHLAVQKWMIEGPFDLYQNIQQRDALDSILAMLTTSLTSTSLDCLAQAANLPPGQAKLRDLNLRHGIKGAAAAELVKALDNRRREKSEKVTVGQVTVEAGGQAIVGNVEAASHAGGGSPTKPSKTE